MKLVILGLLPATAGAGAKAAKVAGLVTLTGTVKVDGKQTVAQVKQTMKQTGECVKQTLVESPQVAPGSSVQRRTS